MAVIAFDVYCSTQLPIIFAVCICCAAGGFAGVVWASVHALIKG